LPRWLDKEGDTVSNPATVIAEIETDKATMEVEAVDEGRARQDPGPRRHRRREAVNTPIAILLPPRARLPPRRWPLLRPRRRRHPPLPLLLPPLP
jgi:hypothetical protein